MKKRKQYPDEINAKDWIEKNLDDVWSGIKEIQKAAIFTVLFLIIVIFSRNKRVQKLVALFQAGR